MNLNKRVPEIDGLRVDEAHKGGGNIFKTLLSPAAAVTKMVTKETKNILGIKPPPGPSQAELDAQAAQQEELASLKKKEDARIAAMGRARRGRASLISGTETGMKQTLGQ